MRHTQVHAHIIGTKCVHLCVLTHFWAGTAAPAENKRWRQPGWEIRTYTFETSSLQRPQQSTLHAPGLSRTRLALLPLLCHFFLTCKLRRAMRSWAPGGPTFSHFPLKETCRAEDRQLGILIHTILTSEEHQDSNCRLLGSQTAPAGGWTRDEDATSPSWVQIRERCTGQRHKDQSAVPDRFNKTKTFYLSSAAYILHDLN